MIHARRLSVALVTIAAPLALLAAPAEAQVGRASDPKGDVAYYDSTDDRHPETVRQLNGDLTGYRLTHGRKRFTAVLRYRDLVRSGPTLLAIVPIVYPGKTKGDTEYVDVELLATKDDRAGTVTVMLQGDARCPVRHRIRYDANRITMSFPTRCLGTPPWVRADVASLLTDDLNDPSYFYFDQAPDNSNGRPGPKLKRG